MNEQIVSDIVSRIVREMADNKASQGGETLVNKPGEEPCSPNNYSVTQSKPVGNMNYTPSSFNGRHYLGVFENMEQAINAAQKAYKEFRGYTLEQKERIITLIRKYTRAEADIMAQMGVEETGMGRVMHKAIKHNLVADKTPGTEDLKTTAFTGDDGISLVEMAPFGIIGAITPSTNPSETVICNSMGMIAGGNVVVFSPHPGAICVSNYAVDLVNRAILEGGGPENLVCSISNPTMENSDYMLQSPAVRMLVATGGPGIVKKLLSSGKKAIGAGAGNPPVVVDDTADIKKAGHDIVEGASFDNNMPCIAEKEVFVMKNVADELIHYMQQNGAYLINESQREQLVDLITAVGKNGKRGINKKWVGKDAHLFLEAIGIKVDPNKVRLIICETTADHPFVQIELMMPVLPIVRVENVDEGIELAVQAEHGNRHTAHMHSKNVDNLTKMAREIETTIFVKNAPCYAGIGAGGEGYTTFTIAGPTGEGLTSAKSFTRIRRCVLSDGFRIV